MPPRSCSSWRIVCLKALPSTPTRLLARHPDVGEEHLAEVTVRRHVLDRADLDSRRVHRHDDLADALVGRPVSRGPADQVAVVGDGGEARPDLLAVDHPLVAVAAGRRAQRGEVTAGFRFGHPDRPRCLAAQDAGQELVALVLAAEGDQRRTHLTIGEPHRRDRCPGDDQLLADDQPVDRRAATTAVFGRPGEADPPALGELAGDLRRVPVDPRVVVSPEAADGVGGEVAGLLTQRLLLRRPGEVHEARLRPNQQP